ncbi:hypothetical protein BMS3Bbin07_01161 [bacterium BMS3Bbin07]|nr:hypothetical protein BMS3Bbin07_01161 [bacterium BMS3Bbin07]
MVTCCSSIALSSSIILSTDISLIARSVDPISVETFLTAEERNCFFNSGRSLLIKSMSLVSSLLEKVVPGDVFM